MNVGIAARNIAQKVPELDENKAYIVGMLHDIGRRVGIVNIPKHVYEGYKYCIEKGWDEVARICMTHSYPLMKHFFLTTEGLGIYYDVYEIGDYASGSCDLIMPFELFDIKEDVWLGRTSK